MRHIFLLDTGVRGQRLPVVHSPFGKLILRHIWFAGHGGEGSDGSRLSIPPLEKLIMRHIFVLDTELTK